MQMQPGEACPTCEDGALWAYCSKVHDDVRVRYYRCNSCGWAPADNKVAMPLKYAPRRINMRRPSTKLGTGRRLRR